MAADIPRYCDDRPNGFTVERRISAY